MNRNPNREQIMVQYSADTHRSTSGVARLRIAIAVLLVAVASLALAPAAFAQTCPTTVTLSAPAANATNVATQGRLEWSTNVAADYFNIYFADGATGACGLTTPTAVTNYGGTSHYTDYYDLAPNTTYSWKIEAVKNGCTTVVSECRSFTTSACHSNGPTLINPQDGATADHLKVVFAWDPILGSPTGYEVFVQINSTGAFVSQGTTDANTFELTKDIPAGMHKWYVEGKLPGGCAPARSATWTFGTACPSGAPSLVSPSAGQTLSSPTDVTFQWSSVSGADGYDVVYSRNGGTEVRVTGPREGTALAGTSLTTTLPGTGSYTWRVEALSSSCANLISANGTFTVTDNCPTTGVTLTAPANNAASVASPVNFSWQPQANATAAGLTGYKVYVGVGGATPGVVAEVDATTTTATYSLPAGTHTWFVESVFSTCAPVRSSTFTFTIAAAPVCSTTAATLTGPANGATNVSSPVTFTWEPVAGRSYYVLLLEGIANVVTTGTSITRAIPEGPRNWSVTTYFQGCPSTTSETRTVTVGTATVCPTTAPTLSSPDAGATVTRDVGDLVTFTWQPVSGAVSYTLTVGTTTIPNLTETLYKLDVPNGTVNWSVAANYGGTCGPVAATARTLIVNSPPPCVLTAPSLIAPASGAETLSPTVTFTWGKVDNATEYRVYRRLGASDTELLGTTTALQLEKTFEFDELPFNITGDRASITWYVEAVGGARCGAPVASNTRALVFRKAANCSGNTAPTLSSPAAGTSTTSREVQFNWERVTGATGYNVWYSFNGGAQTKLNEDILSAGTRSAQYTLPLGASEWWVEAVFPGCPAIASLHRAITITTPCVVTPPTIVGPDGTAGTYTSPVTLTWSRVPNATSYDVFVETPTSPYAPIATVTPTAGSTGNITFVYTAQPGGIKWKVRANVPNCGSATSAEARFTVVATPPCTTPDAPRISVQAQATSNVPYTVSWRQVPNALTYEVEESSGLIIAPGTITTVTGTSTTFSRSALFPTQYFYRVRAKSSCNQTVGPWSDFAIVSVIPPAIELPMFNIGPGFSQPIISTVFFTNPFNAPTPFTATGDQPWVTVSPTSGTMPAAGMQFTVTSQTGGLGGGTNTGSVLVTFTTASAGNVAAQGTTVYTIPVSVNVVSPVTSAGKTEPPADAVIIPAVAAADGANNSQWVSDVRVTNASGEPGRYQVNFTPSGQDAGRVSNTTTIDIPAGSSMALDSVLRNWFGATSSRSLTGVMEVRSLKTGSTTSARRGRQLLGSSRTYNRTPSGTYGQFIPAIPVNEFAAKGQVLTLSELNQSASYRTNLGLVEGSGKGANVRVTVFDANGTQLTTFDQYLRGGEHLQMDSFMAKRNVATDNARANVEVLSDTGTVMAYASVVDNQTNDPLLVTGETPAADTAWVIAGVADLDTGAARWRTDVRIYNPTAAAVAATLNFYATGDPSNTKSITTSIPARSTKELKDILRNSFSLTQVGGAIHVTTATSTPLLVTARTYNQTTTGTYGQFIPGVPKADGIGLDEGTIQLQQLEGSGNFRTNIGLAEVTGKPVTVELIAVIPGTLATPRYTVKLKANEFNQLLTVFKNVFGQTSDIYNARIAVRVIEGQGKIIAYASVIDAKTQDPTFVPAER